MKLIHPISDHISLFITTKNTKETFSFLVLSGVWIDQKLINSLLFLLKLSEKNVLSFTKYIMLWLCLEAKPHCVKSFRVRSYRGPYFWSVFSRIGTAVFSPNVGKYGLKQFQIHTLFTQCLISLFMLQIIVYCHVL